MVKEIDVIKGFKEVFNIEPEYLIDTGGRFEICGNHTDHNHGLCLVANCSLRVKAAISKLDNKVEVLSKGYSKYIFSLDDLSKKEKENHTTLSLNKGILFKLKELFSRMFLFVKDPTHKKYYVVHFFGIRFGLGSKDDKRR